MTEPPAQHIAGLSPERRALLAERLRARTRTTGRQQEAGRAGPCTGPAAPPGPAPASTAQRRLHFLDSYRTGSPLYLVPAAFDLTGPLDVPALGRALTELVRRHDVLRTVFEERGDSLVQVVQEPFPLAPEPVDLSGLPEGDRAARLRAAAAAETQPAMDLSTGPLIRAELLALAPREHRLVLTLHHIVADGWTLSLLVREFAVLYEAYAGGLTPRLDPPPLQYGDHAVAERARLAGAPARDELEWWTSRLRGLPPLDMPTDRPRPAVQGWAGARHTFTVPAGLTGHLRDLAGRTGTTLFTVLLAAYAVVLHRCSGQRDFAVGSAVAGRTTPEVEGLAGLVANTLVLRTEVSGTTAFEDLLASVADTVLDAHERQQTPFEALVDRLEEDRDPSRHPLFQASFNLQNVPPFHEVSTGGLRMTFRDMTGDTAKCDLGLALLETEAGLRGELEYSTELFDRTTAERLAGHYLSVLRGVAADAGRPVGELPLMSARERDALVAGSAGAPLEVPATPVHRLVARRARAAPGAPALVTTGRTYSYAEMDRCADALARRLRELGAGPERLVGIGLERSAEQVIACLAVLKSGAAFVPMDPQYPSDRLAAIREDAGLRLLITDRRLRTRFPMGRTTLVYVEDALTAAGTGGPPECGAHRESGTDAEPEAIPGHAPQRTPEGGDLPSRLAYVLHTSGSTGRPKGVAVEHRNLSNFVAWYSAEYGLSPEDRVALLFSPGFDASLCDVWPTLCSGAAIHVAPEEARTDPARLARWLVDEGVTVTAVPTPLGEALLAADLTDRARLRTLLVGGEALTRRPDESTPFRMVNVYGPAETTVIATTGAVEPGPPDAETRLPSIGGPIANLEAHVLDSRLQPVPVGVPGELHIGGAQVSRGYLNRPGHTAERFLPDPFSGRAGARLYATGDVVRRLPGGGLDFVGRIDDQVKIRGFRIELGEVEAALRSHPAISEAAVTVRSGGARQRALIAHLVPAEAGPVAADVRRHLKDLLPHYMVPAQFVVRDDLPLTVHGKVDRKALAAAPLPADDGAVEETVPPRGPVEERVARLWCEVLDVPSVGAHDNFFDLGGHSFLVLKLQERLRETVGHEVPVVAVFQHPTVAAFAAYLDSATKGETQPGRPGAEGPAAPEAWAGRRRAALDRAKRNRRPRAG
ncbi:amino acid adenylation domain-containing protein [Streptomyces sp. JJ36]|uniref:non-ribosomal peptide synthetase n=1 Tax=Streptomyces sp. JJ36 TaxID=2736645 RepID=UPI001F3E0F7A|nr:amino acid adenylation domain-containing protein [Streptomyces sp. JJ36]MCF6525327.1 amino acid adenylation domain-containing protein [Streptomyces sp. JJ36]